MERRYNVRIETDEDGWYIGSVPSVPGVADQGDTPEGAYRNTLTALQFTIECMVEDGEEIPLSDLEPVELRSARISV